MSLAFASRDEMHAAHIERRRRLWTPQPVVALPRLAVRSLRPRNVSIGPDACEHVRLWRVFQSRPAPPNRVAIAKKVCAEHSITFTELCSPRRATRLVRIRWQLFYRLAAETAMSLPEIGRFSGGRDHTTVLHGIRGHARLHNLPIPRRPMTEDCPIVSQHHALLQPGIEITAEVLDDAHMAVLRGELAPSEFRAIHGDEAGEALAREMGEACRG